MVEIGGLVNTEDNSTLRVGFPNKISDMSKTILERIELEKRGKQPKEVRDLNLDNCRGIAEIDEALQNRLAEFETLESLSLINANLSSVKRFPNLANLKKLELSDNRIATGLEHLVTSCPNITHLSLSGNKIQDIEALRPLEKLVQLKSLDLFNCEVTNIEDYREKSFKMLPSLQFLDGFDAFDKEADDEEDEEDGEEVDGEEDDDEDDGEVEIDEEGLSDDDIDDEDPEEAEDEEDVEGEEEEEVGLEYLEKDNLDEESEGEEFNPEEDEEGEAGAVPEEDGEDADARGTKRKHDGEEEADAGGDA